MGSAVSAHNLTSKQEYELYVHLHQACNEKLIAMGVLEAKVPLDQDIMKTDLEAIREEIAAANSGNLASSGNRSPHKAEQKSSSNSPAPARETKTSSKSAERGEAKTSSAEPSAKPQAPREGSKREETKPPVEAKKEEDAAVKKEEGAEVKKEEGAETKKEEGAEANKEESDDDLQHKSATKLQAAHRGAKARQEYTTQQVSENDGWSHVA